MIDCYEVGKLRLMLDNLNNRNFEKHWRNNHGYYYSINLEVRFVFRSGLVLEAIFPGERLVHSPLLYELALLTILCFLKY
jgi:hypothetical protein